MSQGGPPSDNQQQLYGQAPQYNPNPSPSPQPYQIVNPNIAYTQQPQPMYGGQVDQSAMPAYQQQYSPQPYQQYPQGQTMMQPMQTTQGEPHPQQYPQQQMIMVTSSSSPQQPMIMVAHGNPYYNELIGHRCCCSCCDIRTGVMILGLYLICSGIFSLYETADAGSFSTISWIILFGDLFCGGSGMYGAYHYNWKWTFPLLIWLYLACIMYVIFIIIIFAIMSILCQFCYDDDSYNDNDEDSCYTGCASVFTAVAIVFIAFLILEIYFTYVVQTFVRLLRQAEDKIKRQAITVNANVNVNASASSQSQAQTTVDISTIR